MDKLTVQQIQAVYAIAVCNELLDAWGYPDKDIDDRDPDVQEIFRIRDDIAATNDVQESYRLRDLAKVYGRRYVMEGASR